MAYAVPRYAGAMDGCIASAVIVGVFGLWVVWPTASVSELASRLLRAPPEGADALLRRLPTPQVIAVIRHALTDPSRGGRIGGRPDLVERWIELDPVGALPHALELAAAGNPEPAERACGRVLRDQPRHVAAREGWARLRWNAGDVEGALRLLDGGVRDEPALLMVRADIALAQGRRGDAAQLVQDVLRLAERSDHPPTRAVADQADRMRLLLLRDLEGDGATLRDLARSGKLAPNSGQNHTLVGLAAMARAPRVARDLSLQRAGAAPVEPDPRLAAVRGGERLLRNGDPIGAQSYQDGLRERGGQVQMHPDTAGAWARVCGWFDALAG